MATRAVSSHTYYVRSLRTKVIQCVVRAMSCSMYVCAFPPPIVIPSIGIEPISLELFRHPRLFLLFLLMPLLMLLLFLCPPSSPPLSPSSLFSFHPWTYRTSRRISRRSRVNSSFLLSIYHKRKFSNAGAST